MRIIYLSIGDMKRIIGIESNISPLHSQLLTCGRLLEPIIVAGSLFKNEIVPQCKINSYYKAFAVLSAVKSSVEWRKLMTIITLHTNKNERIRISQLIIIVIVLNTFIFMILAGGISGARINFCNQITSHWFLVIKHSAFCENVPITYVCVCIPTVFP